MTVRDMARLHGMNNPFNTWNRANSATATSANTAARAPAPDWSEIPTKETPKMSEEEFEQTWTTRSSRGCILSEFREMVLERYAR